MRGLLAMLALALGFLAGWKGKLEWQHRHPKFHRIEFEVAPPEGAESATESFLLACDPD